MQSEADVARYTGCQSIVGDLRISSSNLTDVSAFHRVRFSDEIWHLYAGGPLDLHLIDAGGRLVRRRLTSDVLEGEPTAVVPAGTWQSARLAAGARFALGGCSVAPGFEYEDFEMPPAAELIGRFPNHAAIIRELTRR